MTERWEDVDRAMAALRERTTTLSPPAGLEAAIVRAARPTAAAAIWRLAMPAAALASLVAAALWLVALERSAQIEELIATEAMAGPWR